MGNYSSGLQREQRLSAIHRLAHDIKMVKLELAGSRQRRRRATTVNFLLCAVAFIATFVVFVVIFNRKWWESALFATPVLLVLAVVQKCLGCYFDHRHKGNVKKLKQLKTEKAKMLDVIKNTESYAVTKSVLDEFDKSDDDVSTLIEVASRR